MIKRFIIYGLTGWCLEVAYTGFGQLILTSDLKLKATTSIWMFFIYGLAIFLERIHDRIRSWPILVRGGIYCILIFSAEYATGYILRESLDACPWNYSSPHAINGLIKLDFIPIWFTLGLFFEKYHDILIAKSNFNKYATNTKNLPTNPTYIMAGRMKKIMLLISHKINPKRPGSNTG